MLYLRLPVSLHSLRKVGLKNAEIEMLGLGKKRELLLIEDAIDQLVEAKDKGSKGEIYHIGIDKKINKAYKGNSANIDIVVSCSQLLLNRRNH